MKVPVLREPFGKESNMNIIVTVDENWAIGNQGRLLVQIPADQRFLQQTTAGKTMVLGRKTLQAMPQGQPLYGRETIVLSEKPDFQVKGAKVVSSLDALWEALAGVEQRDIYVCGGNSLYQQLLAFCDTAYVTMVEKAYAADTYFENLDRSREWVLTEESEEQTYFDITYYFRKYERVAVEGA